MKRRYLSLGITLITGGSIFAMLLLGSPVALANNQYQPLNYSYVWGMNSVTAENDWSAAPGILGYTGADSNISGTTRGVQANPQTILDDLTTGVNPLVHANELSMDSTVASNYAVVDFHPTTGGLTKAMIALHANSKFDAPFLVYHISTTGKSNVQIQYDVIDIDSGGTDATQEVALHYRIGSSGAWTNIPAGYIADATAPVAQAKKVTHITANLPANAWNQAQVQFRVLTANANGADEFIAVDNVSVTGTNSGGPTPTNTSPAPTATHTQPGPTPTNTQPTGTPPTPNPALNLKLYVPIVVQ